MNAAIYIAIYLPIFIVLFVILPMNHRQMFVVRKLKKLRGERVMSNELIKSCIGKICTISTGSMGASYSKVEIVEVADNWIKVQGKGKTDIVNIDFIQSIKIYA
jgi:hypothetical protein